MHSLMFLRDCLMNFKRNNSKYIYLFHTYYAQLHVHVYGFCTRNKLFVFVYMKCFRYST